MEIVSASTPPPPFPKSNLGVSIFPFNPKFPFIFLILTLIVSTATSQFSEIPYSQYCNDFLPESPQTDAKLRLDTSFLRLNPATFSIGGFQDSQLNSNPPESVSFFVRKLYKTESNDVLKLTAILHFQGFGIAGYFGNFTTRRRLRLVQARPRRFPTREKTRNTASFKLYGFWSSISGKLCMVGSGVSGKLRPVDVILKLHFPNSANLVTSLVNGTLQSIQSASSVTYFEPISILGVSNMGYNFSYIDRAKENGDFNVYDDMENMSLGLEPGRMVCIMIRTASRFELEYGHDCDPLSCNFLNGGGRFLLPRYMSFSEVKCLENGKVRYLLKFSNSSYNGYLHPFDPSTTLLAEGAWDQKKKRLPLVACPILNNKASPNKSLVGDCKIRLSLSIPSTLSLRNRSNIVGKIWSNGHVNDSRKVAAVAFRSPGNIKPRLKGVTYQYTENETVSKFCTKKLKGKGKKGTYPSGNSPDMRFDMAVRSKIGLQAWGYSSPLTVGDKFYVLAPTAAREAESSSQENQGGSSEINISYVMSFTSSVPFALGSKAPAVKSVEISAEGMYNPRTGIVCMIGCRHTLYEQSEQNEALDCEILVSIQYPPLTGKDGGHVQGTIESNRNKSDPLYFDRLLFASSSITTAQAKESLWRMDLEITMVLISNAFACVFVGLQLFYVNKNADVLPFISIVMLVVLTLAHMVPLLLNFEAMFLANSKQNVFLGKDGWVEVNEVLVRIITMIAFLLQFRLLQLTWSTRNSNESQKSLWISDKKVLYLSLPLYVGGGLIAWFAHLWKNSNIGTHHLPSLRGHPFRLPQVSFWGELKTYAGLLLDGFLVPQIVFNFFCDSRERALAPSFYLGTTIVRLLPHVYDLYRARSSLWFYDQIYANTRMDYYSTAWDVIISCSGLLCVLVIFLQQRFGGRCFLPKRFRGSVVYEKVPVIST